MSRRPIDLARVRAALARLDGLAAEHPEAFAGRTAEQWTPILQEHETMGTVPKGRPLEGAEHTTQIGCRVPDSMLVMLDAWRAKQTQPGLTITRSDALSMILAATLEPSNRR